MSGMSDLPPATGEGVPEEQLMSEDDLVILHSLAVVGMSVMTGNAQSAAGKQLVEQFMDHVHPEYAYNLVLRVGQMLSAVLTQKAEPAADSDAEIINRLIAEA
jgi:hypothetical protein